MRSLRNIVPRPGTAGVERGKELRFCLVFALLTVAIFAALYAAHDAVIVPLTLEFWQQMPIRGPDGRILYLPGHSALGLRVASALSNFFEIMGRGFFALLVYLGLIVFAGAPRRAAASGAVGPNDPCPCGSARKFKRGGRASPAALVSLVPSPLWGEGEGRAPGSIGTLMQNATLTLTLSLPGRG